MNQYGWKCYRKWQPNYFCNMVSCYDGHPSHAQCNEYCRPPNVPDFDLIGMTTSCQGSYVSEPRATNPQQCAAYCNKEINGCQYFMWDSTKSEQDSTFITDSNCIMFTEMPDGCMPLSMEYPATNGSLLYKKRAAA